MKKTFSLVIAIALSLSIYAQAPQSFAYQGIARNSLGNPIANQLIAIRASILDATSTGTSQYTETQSVTTNSLGLFSVSIGMGTVQSGAFSAVTWATGLKFMKVEFDPTGGTSYVLSGTQQILSVPYALNALNAKTYVAGTSIAVSGSTITNTAPNQTVAITGSGATTITGAYPTYTISSPVTPTLSLVGSGSTTVTGTYPTYTVNTDLSPCFPKYITNVNLVNISNGNNSSLIYTSVNCTSYIPAGASHVILNVVGYSAGFYLNFRKDASSSSIYSLSGNSSAVGWRLVSNLNYVNTALIIPIDAFRTFQYLFTNNGISSTGSVTIDLIGYY